MLVVDASCLIEVLIGGPSAPAIREHMSIDPDQVAPHVIDVEVFGVIRRQHLLGELDATAATQAVEDLADWPGERVGHRRLLPRAWELRHSVRGWDAMYVALAESLDAMLLTLDQRLGAIAGLNCQVRTIR